ncbi:colanic acid biosynthesis acetyltransferase WcaF [Winogradskyella undariae]|uniref:WcaF family extracellular polysaccharide biosynthesis acetyltransferase n=1 Tax=Winogradskyella TaxID=286104 RepID=UPI00156AD13D|nr:MULTISPECIES: WcaF family extracellular polysaccharide biosynthesis acetyltransferase [Winogradskyella]NRR91040.1 colanic acid biosynthesis acetyltransferase WcaF [Winogradskyella undariae]QXP80013.1 colanic acid biosynthesis acetyltransferase WcaF [Winogradskyella sp. HaHa_3_26]
MKTDLSSYNNDWYQPGRRLKILCWYFINVLFFINPLNPISSLKVFFLKLFGAQIGTGVVIKPGVSIKYPWLLTIGNHCWIGESVWIDNLAQVTIEDHVCVSQGALLLCGNHNYKSTRFDLFVTPITLREGSWVGAKSIVTPGVTLESHAVLSVCSVATTDLESYSIYQGNPAVKVKSRQFN